MCDQNLNSTCEDNSKTEFILSKLIWTSFVAEGRAELGETSNYGKEPIIHINRFIN